MFSNKQACRFISRLIFMLSYCCLSFSCFAGQNDKQPNIVFLLADDLGYGELGSYGQAQIKTPNIDKLATMGKRFTQFYAGNAVCSPSRAVLMTGKHSGHATIRGNKGHHDYGWGRVSLTKDELTLGQLMQSAGYQTAFIGKWHLEDPNDLDTWAFSRGFDYAVQEQWKKANSRIYFDERFHWINGINDRVLYDYTQWDSLDQFRTNFAMTFLETKRDSSKPFFLFMSYRAPHSHEKFIRNTTMYKDKGWPEKERQHATKITLWDREVGRLLDYLTKTGEIENTLIVLTSDNGGHSAGGHSHEFFQSNGKLRGFKRDLYEGGIRVPKIAVWPGRIEPNSISDHIGAFQDFMPTFAQISGVETPQISDGISLLSEYLGEEAQQAQHEYLYWEEAVNSKPYDGLYRAIRHGDWKAIQYGLNSPIQLYNLNHDLSEQQNLAPKYPEKIRYYKSLFKQSTQSVAHFPYAAKAN